MKNTADQFEDDMKQRLQHYEEEPRRDFWIGIASQISNTRGSGFIKWRFLLLFLACVAPLAGGYVSNNELLRLASVKFSQESIKNSLTSSVLNLKSPSAPIVSNETLPHSMESLTSEINTENQIEVQQEQTITSVIKPTKNDIKIEALTNQKQVNAAGEINSISDSEKSKKQLAISDSLQANEKVKEFSVVKEDKANGVIVRELKKNRKHSIYVIAMPTFGYQRIESNPNDNIIIESISRVPAFSTRRLGVRVEIGVEYKLSPSVKVFGGLLYYQRKQTIDFIEKQVDSLRITGVSGEVSIEPVFKNIDRSIEYELKNVGIQGGFNYEISKKKFLHVIGTGIELHKPLNKADFNEIGLGFGQKPNYYVFYNLYYRLQYPSEGRLRAVLQPSLNYSLYIHQNWNAPFYVKPYGLGLHIGATYNF